MYNNTVALNSGFFMANYMYSRCIVNIRGNISYLTITLITSIILTAMRYIVINLVLFLFLRGMILEIPVDQINYQIEKVNGYDRISLDQGIRLSHAPGFPEIPVLVYNYVIPKDQTVREISILDEDWETVGHFAIYPTQKAVSLETTCVFTEPNREIYDSAERFPLKPVISFNCGNLRGYRLVQITVVPFKYTPQTKTLCYLKRLKIEMLADNQVGGVAPARQTRLSSGLFDRFLSNLVMNDYLIDNKQFRPPTILDDNPGDSIPTDMPSLLGPPVDFVIITDSTQASAYGNFARLKKLFGLQTAVRTMDWVRQHYTGVDDAERIRYFLKDAVAKWGTSFVLLGGDTPLIPTRFVWIDRTVIFNSLWLPIASDLYYSDLDGNWNYDGDDKFGEVEDSLDLYPDIFVGRLPTTSSDEVLNYLDKLNTYLFPADHNIQTKALFFSSKMDDNWPGLPYAETLAVHLPQHFTRSFLDEGLNNFTLQTLKDSIHAGFGIVAGIGHGGVNKICTHFMSPRVFASNFFFDSLANTALYSLMAVVSCYTNPFQSDCIGEHWILDSNGGGIAYIGPTSSSECNLHTDYMKFLFDSLFIGGLSQSLAIAKIPFIGSAGHDNWERIYQFSICLLGDPTLVLWDTLPVVFNPIMVEPGTLQVGDDTVIVTCDTTNSGLVNIVFYKEGETFIRDSTNTNTLRRQVKTKSPGYLKYNVMSDNYISFIDSILVTPLRPYLVYDHHKILDAGANPNGVINPGEDICMHLIMQNNGGSIAYDVHAQLLCLDSLVIMITDTTSFPDIHSGGQSECYTPLCFHVSDSMPDQYAFSFEISISYSETASNDSFQVTGAAPVIIPFTQEFTVIGDTVTILPYVANQGHNATDTVCGVIRAYSDTVAIIDSVVYFSVIDTHEIVSSEPDSLKVCRRYPGGDVRYNFLLYHHGLEVANRDIIIDIPSMPDSLRLRGMKHSIVLDWSSVSGVIGYRVYRALDSGGPYTFLDNHLEPICHFEDYEVQAGQEYHYYVVSVDSSMNHSESSDTVSGKSNPMCATGWPQIVYDHTFSSPNFADLDPTYPGLEIIVCGYDACVYAWHHDGSPLTGTDGRLFDAGEGRIWSSPAVGDVDNDGLTDIVFGVQRGVENLYVINYNPIDSQVAVLPGWPKSLNGGGLVSSPVLADINQDGDLEIFASTFASAHLYAFHHDGSGVYSPTDGLLKTLYGAVIGTPAIGDLDRDGNQEIISGGGSSTDSLFVWDRYGNYLPPFPVTIEECQKYSVVIGDVIGDSCLEICFYAGDSSSNVSLVDHYGNVVWQRVLKANYNELSPAFGDVNNDGRAEVICSYNDELDAGVIVFDSAGNALPGFPKTGHDAYPPLITDIDGDDNYDIVVGSTEWSLYAYGGDGSDIPGFPIRLGHAINSVGASYDIDLDGKLELMISCYDYKFYVFDLDSRIFEWPRFRYDPYNSGCYKSGYYTSIKEMYDNRINNFGLEVYPNPFRNAIGISFSTAQSVPCGEDYQLSNEKEDIELKIYDVTGRVVKNFNLPKIRSLKSSIAWDGLDDRGRVVASGVFFVKFECGDRRYVKKIVKIK